MRCLALIFKRCLNPLRCIVLQYGCKAVSTKSTNARAHRNVTLIPDITDNPVTPHISPIPDDVKLPGAYDAVRQTNHHTVLPTFCLHNAHSIALVTIQLQIYLNNLPSRDTRQYPAASYQTQPSPRSTVSIPTHPTPHRTNNTTSSSRTPICFQRSHLSRRRHPISPHIWECSHLSPAVASDLSRPCLAAAVRRRQPQSAIICARRSSRLAGSSAAVASAAVSAAGGGW